MLGIRRVIAVALAVGALGCLSVTSACAQNSIEASLAQGTAERNSGQIEQAIDTFSALVAASSSPVQQARAEGELGATLVLAHRFSEAEPLLQHAYDNLVGDERARYAVDLGNLALDRHQLDAARRWYIEAAASNNVAVALSARLDLARLHAPTARLVELRHISSDLEHVEPARLQDQFRLNLGFQASHLGAAGLELAYDNLSRVTSDAEQGHLYGLAAQGGDALAQVYEDQHRDSEALRLNQHAMALASVAARSEVAETMVSLDWREARLANKAGHDDDAIAAFQHAVDQIQEIRQDLPIDYEDGRSTFSATLKPIYLGLADLRLRRVQQLPAEHQSDELRAITDTLELLKQAEMQDYLGDRCTVDAIQQGRPKPGPGIAFIYPIVLKDRIEIILETQSGLSQATVPVAEATVDATVRRLASGLRADALDFQQPAGQLYDWLLRPIEAQLKAQSITTIVLVSDGVLRLVPIAVLYDGSHYLVENYASATVTGLSMTNARPADNSPETALIAGMSEAGPVVDALDAALKRAEKDEPVTSHAGADRSTRGLATLLAGAKLNAEPDSVRARLSLPGVRLEVDDLEATLHGTVLLDRQFTERHFEDDAATGSYRIVHIASHGFFGGSASDSFILTYDKLLTIDELQSLLTSGSYRAHPIEILSLSACDTAEGNERSPLGISGAAMKARAKSVIGTLWPVDDHAAQVAMGGFYRGLRDQHLSKAEALREAQLQLLHQPGTARPIYWAPFVLIGNWL
jgi:CHAT domain-containing protein